VSGGRRGKDDRKLTINVPVVYMARDVIILMGENPISRAIGRDGP